MRGAVGLALALIVTHSEVLPPEIGLVTVFNISGIVLLTLVINGTTTGFIIKSLGLKKESKVSQQMLAAILDQHDDVAKEIYLEYHNQEKHGAGTVDQIVEHVDIAKTKGVYDEVLQRMKRETARAKKELEKEMRLQKQGTNVSVVSEFRRTATMMWKPSEEELLTESRQRYLMEVRASYVHNHEQGLLMDGGFLILCDVNEKSIDRAAHPLNSWATVMSFVTFNLEINCSRGMRRVCCIGDYFTARLQQRIFKVYDIVSNYVDCYEHALVILRSAKIQKETMDKLEKEIQGEVAKAKELRDDVFKVNFQDIVRAINSRRAEYYVLIQLIHHYEELNETGQIEDKHAAMIIAELSAKKKAILNAGPQIEPFDIKKALLKSDLGQIFGEETIEELYNDQQSTLNPKDYGPNETIREKGVQGFIYVVVRGVILEAPDKPATSASG